MKSCNKAQEFLRQIDRSDLARLLEYCSYSFAIERGDWDSTEPILYVSAPDPYHDALSGLPKTDQARLIDAFKRGDPDVDAFDTGAIQLHPNLDRTRELTPDEALFAELLVERNVLVAVGTGGPRINEVEDYYRARRARIADALTRLGVDDPNPFPSLWDWYKHYSSTFPSYSERRTYIAGLYRELIRNLSIRPSANPPPREPTGWERVDRSVSKARYQLSQARKEEDFQAVGLLCREAIISVAQAVFKPSEHHPLDGVTPSETDAKRLLEGFFNAELAGDVFEATRKHAKAALDLAVALQHKRTADFRFAALCLEATSSVIAIVSIVSGHVGAS
jgi:hypothetical protein